MSCSDYFVPSPIILGVYMLARLPYIVSLVCRTLVVIAYARVEKVPRDFGNKQ